MIFDEDQPNGKCYLDLQQIEQKVDVDCQSDDGLILMLRNKISPYPLLDLMIVSKVGTFKIKGLPQDMDITIMPMADEEIDFGVQFYYRGAMMQGWSASFEDPDLGIEWERIDSGTWT